MDLANATLPNAIGDLHFGIGAFTGLDRLLVALLPRKWLLMITGKKVLCHLGGAEAVRGRHVTFTLPGEGIVYEIRTGPGDIEIVPWRGAVGSA